MQNSRNKRRGVFAMAVWIAANCLGGGRCERGGPRFCHSRYRLPVRSSGTQVPGFDRYNDGARSFPMPDKWVTNAAKKEALAAAEATFMSKGMVTVPFNPELINT